MKHRRKRITFIHSYYGNKYSEYRSKLQYMERGKKNKKEKKGEDIA